MQDRNCILQDQERARVRGIFRIYSAIQILKTMKGPATGPSHSRNRNFCKSVSKNTQIVLQYCTTRRRASQTCTTLSRLTASRAGGTRQVVHNPSDIGLSILSFILNTNLDRGGWLRKPSSCRQSAPVGPSKPPEQESSGLYGRRPRLPEANLSRSLWLEYVW